LPTILVCNGRQKSLPVLQNFIESIYFKGKNNVNSIFPAQETPRHSASCKETARYRLNCSRTICGGLGRLDVFDLVALSTHSPQEHEVFFLHVLCGK